MVVDGGIQAKYVAGGTLKLPQPWAFDWAEFVPRRLKRAFALLLEALASSHRAMDLVSECHNRGPCQETPLEAVSHC